jgi:hypothetical protein
MLELAAAVEAPEAGATEGESRTSLGYMVCGYSDEVAVVLRHHGFRQSDAILSSPLLHPEIRTVGRLCPSKAHFLEWGRSAAGW